MRTLLSEQFAPVTSVIGFVEAPLEAVTEAAIAWYHELDYVFTATRTNEAFPGVLYRLEPLTTISGERWLLIEAGNWTAIFEGEAPSPDPSSFLAVMSYQLGCRGLNVVAEPCMESEDSSRWGRLGAVGFTLVEPPGPDEDAPAVGVSDTKRNIMVSNQGYGCTGSQKRMNFDQFGEVQPFEEVEAYGARRIRDRFTSEMLERYCQALGVDVFNPDFYGDAGVLFDQDTSMWDAQSDEFSFVEAQYQYGIVPGLADEMPG